MKTERSYKLSKTRDGKPKIRLYLDGRVVLEQPCSTRLAAQKLGIAWEATL